MTDDLQRLQLGEKPARQTALNLRKGKIAIVIHRDGNWSYRGSPIQRAAMVRLFAQQLWLIEESYYIQAPEQLLLIEVEDLPFTIVDVQRDRQAAAQRIAAVTNCGETLTVGEGHDLVLSTPPGERVEVPAIHVRDGLYARVMRNPYYQLVEWGEPAEINGQKMLALKSANRVYSLGAL